MARRAFMTRRTAGRWRITPGVIVALLAGLMLALLASMVVWGSQSGPVTAGKLEQAASLLTIVLVIAVTGLVVAVHQPRNPIGWLLAGEAAFMLLSVAGGGYANFVYRLGHHGLPVVAPLALVLNQLFSYLLIGFPLVILLFPDGRLPSRRWRWVVRIYLAITGVAVLTTSVAVLILAAGHHVDLQADGTLASAGHFGTAWAVPPAVAFFISVGALWLAAVVRQALSWRRSAGEYRQQLKWLASGAAVCGVSGIWAITTNSAIWEVLILGFAALPLSIGLGILKYRLYDIDRIISRTLAYAIVTGLLIGVYAGVVLLATQVLRFHSSVSVAVSTLVAAALFNPARRRVQHAVDRRFNRARYDADQTVLAFAGRLKDAVDLDSVRGDLAHVISRALEPAHLSVWVSHRD